MFKKIVNGCVNVVNRWLPDPFLFAVILTIVVFIAAMVATGMGPIAMVGAWGATSGFWSLLSFSMQMALVLVLGSAMASAKPVKKLLSKLAGLAHNNFQAILITTMVSTICSWLNWGFGLIVGALLAKEVAKRVPTVDYPLLIASAYSGFVIWHAGLSGSIPLALNGGYKVGEVVYTATTLDTIFHPMNIIMCLALLIGLPLVDFAMHPSKEKTITIDPSLLVDEEEKTYVVKTPADKMEHSKILWVITLLFGFGYIVKYFVDTVAAGGNVAAALNLNIVNMIFMFLGILLHGNLRKYVDAIGEAASGAAGILLQFPFYAGIIGMMTAKGADGQSLAMIISNFFVPSGGGQWGVQGPIVMPAAAALGVEPGRAAMAIAWGDQWTNMIQPFWALPALGVAKLSAKDVMGYLVIVLVFTGVVACLGYLAWGMFF